MRATKVLSLVSSCFLIFSFCFGLKAQSPVSVSYQSSLTNRPGDTYQGGSNRPYFCPTPGKIPIVASTPFPVKKPADRNDVLQLIDCGFNLGIVYGKVDVIKNYVNLAENLDFGYMVNNGYSNDYYKTMVEAFRNTSKVTSWFLVDEPTYEKIDEYVGLYNRLLGIDKSRTTFFNLVGAPIKTYLGPIKTFREYLDFLQDKFKPAVWSYDLYPMQIKNSRLVVSYDLFYSDLENFNYISKKSGRPFYVFCQGMAFKNKVIQRPAPKEEYLRFEAFSGLAYGAQGIFYWTYGLRESTDYETYFSALVDLYGKRYPAWYAAQKVNNEIRQYNDIFFGCELVDVIHTGATQYEQTKKLNGSFGPFANIMTENAGTLVSRIKNGSKDYIIIVSHDVEKSQKVALTLKRGVNLTQETDLNINKAGQTLSLTLPKGGYVIFSL